MEGSRQAGGGSEESREMESVRGKDQEDMETTVTPCIVSSTDSREDSFDAFPSPMAADSVVVKGASDEEGDHHDSGSGRDTDGVEDGSIVKGTLVEEVSEGREEDERGGEGDKMEAIVDETATTSDELPQPEGHEKEI